MIITSVTSIYLNQISESAVHKAVEALQRDFIGVFGCPLERKGIVGGNQIRLILDPSLELPPETFTVETDDDDTSVRISGSDDLGLVFGIYHFAEHWLEVDPFQFWTDSPYHKNDAISVPSGFYCSPSLSPRFRGWFINDEDCLIAWDDSITITDSLWGTIFETMLRAGYNMVIPGTGTSPEDHQLDIAAAYGLWIAQHHAEPLGASMFHDVFPDISPRLPEEKERFGELYRNAVTAAGHRKMVWTLGFRGQGDRPFFEDDPRYDTPEKRGALIREMIDYQKQIVTGMTEGPHHFIHYLYSESGKLYRAGHLHLPNDIIRVFSDNGFGAMRVRRNMGEPEPGIPSVPDPDDRDSMLGVYYHVSFHDLEISNKLVPLVHPDVVIENLTPFTDASGFVFFICNVSNIRPHLLHLSLLRSMWSREPGENLRKPGDTFGDRIKKAVDDWTCFYFPGAAKAVRTLLYGYFDAPFSYNDEYADSRAGEQIYHHGLRRMIRSTLRQEDLRRWFTFLPLQFGTQEECCRWLLERAEASLSNWEKLSRDAKNVEGMLEEGAPFFRDNLGMHIRYMNASCRGFVSGIKAFLAFRSGDYIPAYIWFYRSKTAMRAALDSLLDSEREKWSHFYRGDWLTGTRETIRYLETVIGYVRIRGEDLYVNSPWMIRALNLNETAIATLPQSNISFDILAEALEKSRTENEDYPDLTILRNETV